VWNSIEELRKLRSGWAFPSDGLVVKVDLREDQQMLGSDDEGPRWAVAYKFAPERKTTRLQAISLQVGRTGVITPVAELAPVQLGGATVTRANLHNADEIARRDLRVGDHVIVERGGEIIPAVVAVDLTRREADSVPFVFPTTCPSCGRELDRREKQVAWRCPNERCAEQIKRRVRHFASPAGVGIRGLGPATIEKLVDSGCVQNVSDLYTLTGPDISSVLGEPTSKALLDAIDQSRNGETWRVVQGLGIEGVGPKIAKRLCERFVTMDALAAAEMADLQGISGISTKEATRTVEFFASEEGRRLLVVLRPAPILR
jgi:DNA ligase (NAD+)